MQTCMPLHSYKLLLCVAIWLQQGFLCMSHLGERSLVHITRASLTPIHIALPCVSHSWIISFSDPSVCLEFPLVSKPSRQLAICNFIFCSSPCPLLFWPLLPSFVLQLDPRLSSSTHDISFHCCSVSAARAPSYLHSYLKLCASPRIMTIAIEMID